MARLTVEAASQVRALGRHYQRKGRIEAAERLRSSVEAALRTLDATAAKGRPFPSIYQELASPDRYWLRIHRYWFAYEMDADEAIITHVLYDQANIPGRLAP